MDGSSPASLTSYASLG